jgi:hypothetical protein
MHWARGLIDNQWHHYIREDGTIHYRGEELPQSARMLTQLALYFSYADDKANATAFLLSHFDKAKAIAEWLMYRRSLSLHFPTTDPRHGMIPGDDEADNYNRLYYHQMSALHFFSTTAETYRAFVEMGAVWQTVGKSVGRADVTSHGATLVTLAPALYKALHASLQLCVNTTASPGDRCYPHRVEEIPSLQHLAAGQMGNSYRTYPELFFSGALTEQQTDDMYKSGMGLGTCRVRWWLSMGSPAAGPNIFSHVALGFPHGLLQHDMVERFLLYFFTQSAHVYTRGFFMTPESASIIDRSHEVSYSAAGPNNIVVALKWLLVFEEPETRTLWLGKAVPRDWLVPGESPLVAEGVTTRYGRLSFSLQAVSAVDAVRSGYAVHANVTLPPSCGTGVGGAGSQPAGGLVLRIRAPMAHAGKLSGVTVGGQAWAHFNASAETIEFTAAQLTPALVESGLPAIVATFAATHAVPLRRRPIDMSKRVIPEPAVLPPQSQAAARDEHMAGPPAPPCPSGLHEVESFAINGTAWVACEDLQKLNGPLVLLSGAGKEEWFNKGYEPYGTNTTDDRYYFGLSKDTIANATSDVLGHRLLCNGTRPCEPTWAAVERAVPPIRKSGRGGGGATSCDGIRTFVGSRSASIDFTFSDLAEDCGWNGSPSVGSYAQGMHNKAVGASPQSWNRSGVADGLLGDVLPAAVFYFPVLRPKLSCTPQQATEFCNRSQPQALMCASECPKHNQTSTACVECMQCRTTLGKFCKVGSLSPTRAEECSSCVASLSGQGEALDGRRYWSYVNLPVADMKGSREQSTWMRLQQIDCAGPDLQPPCKLVDWPEYFDTMWFSRFPSSTPAGNLTGRTGSNRPSNATGFYTALLELRKFWQDTLQDEGMMELALPSLASTNGTYLQTQAVHSIVRSMITRDNFWHPDVARTQGLAKTT